MDQIISSLKKRLADSCTLETPGYALAISRTDQKFTLVDGLQDLDRKHPITLNTAFDAGSIAKTLTGLSIALLEDQSMLSLSQSVRHFLPELPEFANVVTLRHLLSHESGLHNYTTLLYFMAGWHQHAPPSSADVLRVLCRTPGMKWVPGTQYEYADVNYFLLAQIIERVSGTAFGQFVANRIFEPLGMKDSYCTDSETTRDGTAEGYAGHEIQLQSSFELRTGSRSQEFYPVGLRYRHVGAEGFRTSAHDLLRLGKELLSPTVFSSGTIARVIAASRIRDDGLSYGYGLNVGEYLGQRFHGHDGQIEGFTASLSVFPDHHLVIACLTNRLDLGAWTCRRHIMKQSLGVEPSQHQQIVRVTGTGSTLRPGHYIDPETSSILEISAASDGLVASRNFGPTQSILYSRDSTSIGNAIVLYETCKRASYVPFANQDSFGDYEGSYACPELETVFRVRATPSGVRLVNQETRHPSMDLDYTLTIPDFFWSRDPYPGISQIQFLREGNIVTAFIYRDYDGDGREAFRFSRVDA